MQHSDKTTLCTSEQGSISISDGQTVYVLTFKQMTLQYTAACFHDLKRQLDSLQPLDWFRTETEPFAFVHLPPLEAYIYLTRSEVCEIRQLLSEAMVMMKVRERLLYKPGR